MSIYLYCLLNNIYGLIEFRKYQKTNLYFYLGWKTFKYHRQGYNLSFQIFLGEFRGLGRFLFAPKLCENINPWNFNLYAKSGIWITGLISLYIRMVVFELIYTVSAYFQIFLFKKKYFQGFSKSVLSIISSKLTKLWKMMFQTQANLKAGVAFWVFKQVLDTNSFNNMFNCIRLCVHLQ